MSHISEENSAPKPAPTRDDSLNKWLDWLETIHPESIDMGLERIGQVADRLSMRPLSIPLILVAGTNGKGSTVSMLSAIYTQAGYRVGAYTSPHIEHFCERICVDGIMVDESEVVDALVCVEQSRSPQTLTYFEYTTLAAMHVFQQRCCDVLVFEVGLGGRLDATNIWDPDCSIVTSIALDHEDFLGSDIELIAQEKAAIGRRGRPLILGEVSPPASLFDFIKAKGFLLSHIGALSQSELPKPGMPGIHQQRNAACAVAAVRTLHDQLPVCETAIDAALSHTSVRGRFEQLSVGGVTVILDVAHNPAGAAALCDTWQSLLGTQRCEIIFAALADKDLDSIIKALTPIASRWHCLALEIPRAASLETLATLVSANAETTSVEVHDRPDQAWHSAYKQAQEHSHAVLVAGSFHTLAAMRQVLNERT